MPDRKGTQSDPVATGCQPLDDLLGGGLDRRGITQVYGAPATGKTTLALQTTAATLSSGGCATWFDAEGLSLTRFRQVLRGYGESPKSIADSWSHICVYDFEGLISAIGEYDNEQATTDDLVVIDNATGFYRLERMKHEDIDSGEPLRTLVRMLTHLLGLARRNDLAIVLTNQVYSDPDTGNIQPLGGHTLAHWTSIILRIDRYRGGNRQVTLEKHPSKEAGSKARIQIVESGLTVPR